MVRSCFKPVEIHSAWKIPCVKSCVIVSCVLPPIDQSRYLPSKHIINFQYHHGARRYLITNNRGRIEWVRVILRKRELLRQIVFVVLYCGNHFRERTAPHTTAVSACKKISPVHGKCIDTHVLQARVD